MTDRDDEPIRGLRRGTSLRFRLLLGLGLAVVVPILLFWLFAAPLLRDETMEGLGRHLLTAMARRTADRIGNALDLARSKALTFCQTSDLRSVFGAGTGDFARFHPRVSELTGDLGDVVLARPGGRVLFQRQDGNTIAAARGSKLADRPWQAWRAAAGSRPRVFPPVPNPLSPSASVSVSQDPEQYVLPLVVPIRDDTQRPLGACFFLLPFSGIQDVIENTRNELVEDADIESGEVFLVDRARGLYILHTDRARIGARPSGRLDEGFADVAGGKARVLAPVPPVASLDWIAGVGAGRAELLRIVDAHTRLFLVIVVLGLGATLGIATLISVAATRSLGRLERVTEEVGAGNLATRAAVAGPREVRKLAAALNQMAAQLEAERERLKAAERDRAWTAMARQVAHEIKNPLQPVKLHAELIRRLVAQPALDAAESGRVRTSAGVILRQVDALKKIVRAFSDYAQAAMPIRERLRFPARQVMSELVQLYAAGGSDGVAVRFRDESGDALLQGSPLRLQQVLVNLIKNAIEASEEAGATEVEVVARVGDGVWVAEVADRGSGLPAGGAVKAFEPSYSTKPGGTGLGLAICRRNVEAMDGRIELLPRAERGVVAHVEIPLAASGSGPPQ